MVGLSAPRYIKVVALMPIECSLVPRPLTRELPITITWSLQPAAGADEGDEGTAIVLRQLVFATFLAAAPISTTGILCRCVCWWPTAVCRCSRTCCWDSEWRGRDLGAGTGRWGRDLAGTSLWLDGPSDDVARNHLRPSVRNQWCSPVSIWGRYIHNVIHYNQFVLSLHIE